MDWQVFGAQQTAWAVVNSTYMYAYNVDMERIALHFGFIY